MMMMMPSGPPRPGSINVLAHLQAAAAEVAATAAGAAAGAADTVAAAALRHTAADAVAAARRTLEDQLMPRRSDKVKCSALRSNLIKLVLHNGCVIKICVSMGKN